jgi:hypothetical protein
MKLIAVATPLTVLLLSFGCGDDEPSPAADSSVIAADGAVTNNDASSPTGEQKPFDSGLQTPPSADAQTLTDAQSAADTDAQSSADTDAGVPDPLDAAVVIPPDAEVIVIEGDAGTGWILTQQCPVSAEADECAKCEDEHCCDAYARYLANPEARAFWQCMLQCEPSAGMSCEVKCAGEHPAGTADVATRTACLAQFCPSECGDDAVTACTSCGQAKCSSQLVAAYASESGFLVQACNTACGADAACQQACVAEYSQGAGLVVLAGDCVKTQCAAECPTN